MNILLGGTCDNGGGSWFLAEAINRYTAHRARSVRGYQSYLQYSYDKLAPTTVELKQLVRWADVIHIREAFLKVDLLKKPVVVTYTGRVFRKCNRSVSQAYQRGWIICVVTPDMMAFCPGVEPTWLPNPRECLAHLWHSSERFSLTQAPTSRSAKQTDKVIEAARRANIPLDIVEQVSYADCLIRKGRAHVTVDQVKYGAGNNATEAWAMGMPVIAGFFRGPYRKAWLNQCGGELPFAEARPSVASLQAVMEKLRDDHRFYAEMQERGQEHFYKYMYAPVVAAKAIRIYERALG